MLPDTDPTDSAHLTVSIAHADFLKAIDEATCQSRCLQLAERLEFSITVLMAARAAALAKARVL